MQRGPRAGVRSLSATPRAAESQKAGTLSGGEQQMCAMGRALMARPKLLMLDEPSMGLAPMFVERIFEIVIEISAAGHDDPARRAERAAWRSTSRSAATCSRRAGCTRRRREGAAAERASSKDLPRRGVAAARPGSAARESAPAGMRAAALAGYGARRHRHRHPRRRIVRVGRPGTEDAPSRRRSRRGDDPAGDGLGPTLPAIVPLPASCARRAASSGGRDFCGAALVDVSSGTVSAGRGRALPHLARPERQPSSSRRRRAERRARRPRPRAVLLPRPSAAGQRRANRATHTRRDPGSELSLAPERERASPAYGTQRRDGHRPRRLDPPSGGAGRADRASRLCSPTAARHGCGPSALDRRSTGARCARTRSSSCSCRTAAPGRARESAPWPAGDGEIVVAVSRWSATRRFVALRLPPSPSSRPAAMIRFSAHLPTDVAGCRRPRPGRRGDLVLRRRGRAVVTSSRSGRPRAVSLRRAPAGSPGRRTARTSRSRGSDR